MAKDYKPSEIEKKWTQYWLEKKTYRAVDNDPREKSYLLIEFPYPSGERLHVGHARSYSCLDAVARQRRMQGKNVMFPFGWDAFGLPAENYAVKTGIHPAITTKKNIDNARKQAQSWGLSFDWDREVNTTDPEYYRWTQWIFVQLFKKGLAYKSEIAVNWCPSCKINLANEEVIDGKCERCGTETERRTQSQWLLKITAYADRLLDDLQLVNFREDIAASQINWIGRKEGAKVNFQFSILNFKNKEQPEPLTAFTTRLDTLFGVTYIVVAPEVAKKLMALVPEEKQVEVTKYIETALQKGERERKQKTEKTGVDTGMKAVNPANGEEIPVWVAEYVMMDVGTGVVMGVPGHDSRDWEFAKKQNLPIVRVVEGGDEEQVYEGEGKLLNSGKYDGVESEKAREQMVKDGLGEKANHYHLRDWVFSRQHYWGEPIPMIYCPTCAKAAAGKPNAGWVPVPEKDLPVKLPEVEKYQPTETGESPLAHMEDFVKTTCPVCKGAARRETDTMPNWAGSSWYFLRYCDPHNDKALADKEKLKYWLPVDWYNGGMEHTTLHLLYSRFWHKFLFDIGVVPTPEPYAKRTSHGVILGPDGRKMSKSKGNVINPDEVISKYGGDTLRLYEMFIGPFDQALAWSWESLEGVSRFMKRIWVLVLDNYQGEQQSSAEAKRRIGQLILKVNEDFEAIKFNTAVAAAMEFVNWWSDHKAEVGRDVIEKFLLVMAPMMPFMAEELNFEMKGEKDYISIHKQSWPVVKAEDVAGGEMTVVVQVNGKLRLRLVMEEDKANNQEEVQARALESENVAKLVGKAAKKVIFVPGRLINFVV